MSTTVRIGLGLAALIGIGFLVYQAMVAQAILGLLLDGVCTIFPVCPD